MTTTVDSPDSREQSPTLSRGSLNMVWYGLVSAMFFVYIGAALALAYGSVNAIIGLGLTILVYGAINRVLSGYALRHGVTVALFSRTLLGRTGSILATMVFAATAIYYAVFEGSILSFAFQAQWGGPMPLWYAVVVLYSMPLVIGRSRRFLDRINGFLMPVYWGGLITAVIWAGTVHGFTDKWLTHGAPSLDLAGGGPGWLATFGAYMGVWIMMMYTMDFAALGRKEDEKFHRTYTFGWLFYALAFGANALIGIFLTFTIPGLAATETGVAGGLVSMLGLFGLLVVFVSQTRINTANYYLALTNLQEFGERMLRLKIPTFIWAVVTASLIFLLMLLPIVEYLLLALAWQGVVITGWVGIALTHILMDQREDRRADRSDLDDSDFARVSLPGVVAWVVSAAVGLTIVQSHVGWGAGLGSVVTPVLAAVIYAAVRSLTGHRTAALAHR